MLEDTIPPHLTHNHVKAPSLVSGSTTVAECDRTIGRSTCMQVRIVR